MVRPAPDLHSPAAFLRAMTRVRLANSERGGKNVKKIHRGLSEGGGLFPATQRFLTWLSRPLLLAGLLLSIPAFYLLLSGGSDTARQIGHALYAATAAVMSADIYWQWKQHQPQKRQRDKTFLDLAIIIGSLISSFPSAANWSVLEWLLRLGLCAVIVLRIATLVLSQMKPGHLVQMLTLALLMLTSAGAGFYWLEPNVHTYADGVWLAFTTVATVGYGDIVPSTPASKVFAVFIVVLGYAMFSLVTASIAALFVEEEEEQSDRELHADIRALAREVAALREELRRRDGLPQQGADPAQDLQA